VPPWWTILRGGKMPVALEDGWEDAPNIWLSNVEPWSWLRSAALKISPQNTRYGPRYDEVLDRKACGMLQSRPPPWDRLHPVRSYCARITRNSSICLALNFSSMDATTRSYSNCQSHRTGRAAGQARSWQQLITRRDVGGSWGVEVANHQEQR
jgi:hypothetical protein